MSLQPAPRLHIMRLLAPCALRYLSFPPRSPRNRLLSRRSRALFSTLILFVLSMLYTAEVTSERNVLLPGVPRETYRLFSPLLCVFPSVAQLAVYFRRQYVFCAKLSRVFFFTRFRTCANDTLRIAMYAFSIKLTRSR